MTTDAAADARVGASEQRVHTIADRDITVVAVDDDTVIREAPGYRMPMYTFGGAYATVEEFLRAKPPADVVLLDLEITGNGQVNPIEGAAAVKAVSKAGYRSLIYTSARREYVLAICLRCGASGVLHKSATVEELIDAVRVVANGGIVVTQALIGLAELVERKGKIPTLTARQREILSARARGETFQSIADRLYISRKTAEDHMNAVNKKFAEFLRDGSPADLERYLGVGPGDLLAGLWDNDPDPDSDPRENPDHDRQ